MRSCGRGIGWMRSCGTREKAAQVQARGAHPVMGELAQGGELCPGGGRGRRRGPRRAGLLGARAGESIATALDTFLAPVPAAAQRFLIYTSGVWVLGPCPTPADESAPVNPIAQSAWRAPHETLRARRRQRRAAHGRRPPRHRLRRRRAASSATCCATPRTAWCGSSAAATTTGRWSTSGISASCISGSRRRRARRGSTTPTTKGTSGSTISSRRSPST